MGFFEAYISFWKNYVNFTGRSSRSAYWYVILWNGIIVSIFYILILVFIIIATTTSTINEPIRDFASILTSVSNLLIVGFLLLYMLATFTPLLALMIRRLHDSNKSGWLVLLGFIPFVGSIIMIIFMCLPSEPAISNDFDF
ncbi:DUF805 domain-containing protein [Paenilisteria rocourtiae]|uniref:Uncharacterized membrane protein YhaH (DUF805 family) n=1 Tax=Listeria rocourtiae TaxID=647910 RepID=A0A4V3DQ15_9LIST|nr:DUF805 domain-containing protein [Listeria rocourtiae]EUJ47901.1 hypothetical protein PROCOU_06958 [Listeria rocourtiae FSL F6-920]MBC1434858.1 DUF805 domain-containing protein [Listeria rocourtiae]MBC1604638.1 DUF805 domain-containing protein [Listeria rocourtiae]TDR54456.1 uncharacterized membrane protein YhaH (DUF805 family) [Listeria rocourtiae]